MIVDVLQVQSGLLIEQPELAAQQDGHGIAHRSHDPADRHQVTPQREHVILDLPAGEDVLAEILDPLAEAVHGRHEAVDQLIQHDMEQEPGAVMGELGVGWIRLATAGASIGGTWWKVTRKFCPATRSSSCSRVGSPLIAASVFGA